MPNPTIEMPASNEVLLFQGVGTLGTWTSKLEDLLKTKGYKTNVVSATVPMFRNGLQTFGGDKGIGIVYIFSHGGPRESGGFCIMTADPVNNENNTLYKSYLDAGTLVPFAPPKGKKKYYAITAMFVDLYWKNLSANSLVFVNACHTIGDGATSDLLSACAAHGSVYAGWNSDVFSMDAAKVAEVFFDRLLGANEIMSKENPPQRPFDRFAVERWMGDSGLNSIGAAQLIIDPFSSGAFGILAPSISHFWISEEKTELHIDGMFGSKPADGQGRVKVVDSELEVIEWGDQQIRCRLPANLTGNLTVEVRGHISNSVPITSWTGIFKFLLKADGTLKEQLTFNVHFRGDVHVHRTKPGETPPAGDPLTSQKAFDMQALTDSTCTMAHSGRFKKGSQITTWRNNGSAVIPLKGASLRLFDMAVITDAKNKKLKTDLIGAAYDGISMTVTQDGQTSTRVIPVQFNDHIFNNDPSMIEFSLELTANDK